MALARIAGAWAERCWYVETLEDMVASAAPIARDTGRWALLGDLYALQARALQSDEPFIHFPPGSVKALRFIHAARLAEEAYGKAGGAPPEFAPLVQAAAAVEASPTADAATREQQAAATYGPTYAPLIQAVEEAVAQGDDPQALQVAGAVLSQARADVASAAGNEPNPPHLMALRYLSQLLWIRGGDQLLPALRWFVEEGLPKLTLPWYFNMDALVQGCGSGWGGGPDVFYDTFWWCYDQSYSHSGSPYATMATFSWKLRMFGRFAEQDRFVRQTVPWALRWPLGPGAYEAAFSVCPGTPPDMRRELLSLSLRFRAGTGGFTAADARLWNHVVQQAPPGLEPAWATETAMQLLETAAVLPRPEAQRLVIQEASRLLGLGGRADLAELALATLDQPVSPLTLRLPAAEGAAADERWGSVVEILQQGAVVQERTASALSAALLLARAYDAIGSTPDCERWVDAASQLLGELALAPGEQASYLVGLACLTPDADRKMAFLGRARQAAEQAGLPLLQEGVAEELAQVALEAGDLATARDALTGLVAQQESRREHLAFDPLLRQQWFADNLGPYRKLLRVAALQGDAALALSCAERMRARVLLDQLAWRKVDLGVNLPPELQQRLTTLREARRQAYGLLARGTGAPTEAAGDQARGAYIPIRGAYIPIRGPLAQGQPLTEEEQAQLRGLLESLAREETALESAIRERIPAYAAACQTAIPTSDELFAAIARDPGLAVLVYTLCDEGLVCVAARGGQTPQVVLVQEGGDALRERIGGFREAIWERKPEAAQRSRELYDLLVKPAEGALAAADRLWVVADGALQLIPFGALQDAQGQYLAQRLAVACAPSLSLVLSGQASRPPHPDAPGPAVVVAAPDTGAIELPPLEGGPGERGAYMPIRGMYLPIRGAYMPIRGEDGVSDALTTMALIPLPGAAAEGERVAQQLGGAQLLTGRGATKAALLQAGSGAEVLHIATHGYADPDVPEFSGLLLAGAGDQPYEVLTAQEVYLWSLQARLVTLSACQTGLGQTVEGEGLLGLTRAFIYAGARDVLCSLWPVSDESTAQLMTGFYAALQGGAPVEDALRQAQQSLLADPATADPFYWAAFVAVRGPQ